MVALINGLSSVGWGLWSCFPLPGSPGAKGSGTSTFLGWQGAPLDQLHQNTWNWDTQDLVNQLLSSLPVMKFKVFKLSQQQLCALGSSWCPPQIHALGHILIFVSWSQKGQMSLSCPNKNPSVAAGWQTQHKKGGELMLETPAGTASPSTHPLLPKNWTSLSGCTYAPCNLTGILL